MTTINTSTSCLQKKKKQQNILNKVIIITERARATTGTTEKAMGIYCERTDYFFIFFSEYKIITIISERVHLYTRTSTVRKLM